MGAVIARRGDGAAQPEAQCAGGGVEGAEVVGVARLVQQRVAILGQHEHATVVGRDAGERAPEREEDGLARRGVEAVGGGVLESPGRDAPN